jgi:hypothetical protein
MRQNRTGAAALTPAAHGYTDRLYPFFGEKHFMVPVCRIRAVHIQIRGAEHVLRYRNETIPGSPNRMIPEKNRTIIGRFPPATSRNAANLPFLFAVIDSTIWVIEK